MAKVFAPNKEYAGVSAGVSFYGGEAHTDDPYLISWFRGHGYKIEEPHRSPADRADLPQEAFEKAEGTDMPETAFKAPEGRTEGGHSAAKGAGSGGGRKSAVAPAQKKPRRKVD